MTNDSGEKCFGKYQITALRPLNLLRVSCLKNKVQNETFRAWERNLRCTDESPYEYFHVRQKQGRGERYEDYEKGAGILDGEVTPNSENMEACQTQDPPL